MDLKFDDDYPSFYAQEETVLNSSIHRSISFRGIDKQRVENECDSFVQRLTKNSLVSRDPIVLFDNNEYCIIVLFKKTKKKHFHPFCSEQNQQKIKMFETSIQIRILCLVHQFPSIHFATIMRLFDEDVTFEKLKSAVDTLVASDLLCTTRTSMYASCTYNVTLSGQMLCAGVDFQEPTKEQRLIVQQHHNQEAKNAMIGEKIATFLQMLFPFSVPLVIIEDYLTLHNIEPKYASQILSKLASLELAQNTCNGLLWTSPKIK